MPAMRTCEAAVATLARRLGGNGFDEKGIQLNYGLKYSLIELCPLFILDQPGSTQPGGRGEVIEEDID